MSENPSLRLLPAATGRAGKRQGQARSTPRGQGTALNEVLRTAPAVRPSSRTPRASFEASSCGSSWRRRADGGSVSLAEAVRWSTRTASDAQSPNWNSNTSA